MEYKWEYCPLCDEMSVICLECGNNTCNGGSGTIEGGECKVCDIAYRIYRENDPPAKPDDAESITIQTMIDNTLNKK